MKKDLTMFGYVLRCAAILVVSTFLTACGKSNDAGVQLSAVNKHPADWLTAHRAAYITTPDVCRSCHGTDLKGGVTKIDCFNQAGLGQCHAGGHPPRQLAHQLPFKAPALHGTEAKKDLIICQDCHGAAGGAGSNPRFIKAIGSLATGCEASGCHLANMAHPKPWKTHNTAGNLANACALCHGALYEGSVSIGAPACNTCHKKLLSGTVPVAGQCVSCHGNPPNGAATPNRAGSHAAHMALGGMSGNCAVCHTGKGTGTTNHGSGTAVPLTFASNFSANSGAASYDVASAKCANVSCHGGQATPVWGSSFDVLSNCTACHASGTAEYNSYNSGKHTYHLSRGIVCRDCHDMTSPSNHFKDVSTKLLDTLPSSTLYSFITYDTVQKSCMVNGTAPSAGVQISVCHPGVSKIWQ
ncbi:MAG TPA: CxxxxCH/CxxCH domain-containing protein [Desulfuromonadales bacterium]|nr:CxxxxCH/CxxCH domain-containing protein [Desulfuromonadales bacterium]